VQVNTVMEIGMGLGFALASAMVWNAAASAQIASIEALNARIKQAKKEGLL